MILNQATCSHRIALRAGKKRKRSSEVVALATVFEKSDTDLKVKEKEYYLNVKVQYR